MGRLAVGIAFLLGALGPALAQPPASQPATTAAAVDPQLWAQMSAIDEKVATITDLTAAFRQEKHTPLLKKPLVSEGTVRVKGSRTLWTTTRPEPTTLLIDGREIRLFYPREKVMEIFPITGRLGALAASPLPRIGVLREFFSFEQIPATGLLAEASDDRYLALRLSPIDPELAEHVTEVQVLLDRDSGFISRARTLDADGDQTDIVFSNVKTNAGLDDAAMEIDAPEGTKITRPLEGLGELPARNDRR